MKAKKSQPRHESDTVVLRYPRISDAAEFTDRAQQSFEFHNDLVSPPSDETAFLEYLSRNESVTEEYFLIIEKSSGAIAGAVNMSQIFLKGFCSAYLGYYLFDGFTGRGLMTAALEGVLRISFMELGLHRLEANIQPGNEASIALVQRCGFEKEGYSRKYLFIAGEWQDHERWAIIREDWEARINK